MNDTTPNNDPTGNDDAILTSNEDNNENVDNITDEDNDESNGGGDGNAPSTLVRFPSSWAERLQEEFLPIEAKAFSSDDLINASTKSTPNQLSIMLENNFTHHGVLIIATGIKGQSILLHDFHSIPEHPLPRQSQGQASAPTSLPSRPTRC